MSGKSSTCSWLYQALLLLWPCLCLGTGRTLAQISGNDTTSTAPLEIVIKNGQELVNSLRNLPPGRNTVLLLSPESGNVINCTGVSVPDYTDPLFTSGVLTIRGANGQVIVDTGHKSGVSMLLTQAARVVYEDIVWTSLCAGRLPFNSRIGYVGYDMRFLFFMRVDTVAVNVTFGSGQVVRRTTSARTIMYMAENMLNFYMLHAMFQDSPYPVLAGWLSKLLGFPTAGTNVISEISPEHMVYQSTIGGQDERVNLTYIAQNNSGALFPFLSESLGTLPAPRMCAGTSGNGAQVAPELLQLNLTICPLWVVNSTERLVRALDGWSTYAAMTVPQRLPQSMILVENVSLATGLAAARDPALPRTLLFDTSVVGPFNGVSSKAKVVSLDVATTGPPLLRIAPKAGDGTPTLYIHKLLLTGLQAAPLALDSVSSPENTSSNAGTSAAAYASALPLWSIWRGELVDCLRAAATGNAPNVSVGENTTLADQMQLQLAASTLVVPLADFKAILAAALRGDAWKTGAVVSAPLLTGITTFEHDTQLGHLYTSQRITIDRFVGWGWTGTVIAFTPDTPWVGSCRELPDMPDALCTALEQQGSPQAASASKDNSVAVGVGVGVGVGGAVLIMGVAIVVVLFRRARRAREAAATSEWVSHAKQVGGDGMDFDSAAIVGTRNSMGDGRGSPPKSAASKAGSKTAISMLTTGFSGDVETELGRQGLASIISAAGASQLRLSHGSTGPVHAHVPKDLQPGSVGSSVSEAPSEAIKRIAAALDAEGADKLLIVGVLGAGAWGKVYQGRWRNLDVAVKTMIFSSSNTATRGMSTYDAAVNEAALCKGISHRNIVATYHFDVKAIVVKQQTGSRLELDVTQAGRDVQEWKMYLVQELCSTTLGHAYRANVLHDAVTRQPLFDTILAVLCDIAYGLVYLHDLNIVHGDMKPANVLLKVDNNCPAGFVAKLADFGLAQKMDADKTHLSNFSKGTPYYVAPEVAVKGLLTKASDIFSFGIIMCEVYMLQPPWALAPGGQYIRNPQFAKWGPETPPAFASLVHRCLEQEPHMRPTATEVAAELEGMLAACTAGMQIKT